MTTGNNIVAAEREGVPDNLAFDTALDRIALKIDLTIKGYEDRLTALLAQNNELTERAKASEAKARDHLEAVLAMARVAGKIAENASVKTATESQT